MTAARRAGAAAAGAAAAGAAACWAPSAGAGAAAGAGGRRSGRAAAGAVEAQWQAQRLGQESDGACPPPLSSSSSLSETATDLQCSPLETEHWRSVPSQKGERSADGMALSYTEIEVEEETFHIFTLPDRRPTAGSSQPVKWLYQMIVESYLYHDGDAEARGTGAFYRLLQRTPGAAGRALCLRKASVGQGLVTDAEWDLLRKPLESSVRVLTLVPVDVAVKAITVFGETDRSAKLIEALGYDRPSEWDEAGEEEGEEEGGEQADGGRDGCVYAGGGLGSVGAAHVRVRRLPAWRRSVRGSDRGGCYSADS